MADENLTLLRLVRDAILSIVRQLEGGNVSKDMIDYVAFRLDQFVVAARKYNETRWTPRLSSSPPKACWGKP